MDNYQDSNSIPGVTDKTYDWDRVFTLREQEKFSVGSYHGLYVDFQDILKKDKENTNAWLGLALSHAGKNDFRKAVSIFVKLKEFPVTEAIRRFLPTRYESWINLAEHFVLSGDLESAVDLCRNLPDGWPPQEKNSYRKKYEHIMKRAEMIRKDGTSPGDIWWYLTKAPMDWKLWTLLIIILAVITITSYHSWWNNYTLRLLKAAENDYFRGVIITVHMKNSRVEPEGIDVKKLPKHVAIEYLYPGDRSIIENQFDKSLHILERLEKLEPENPAVPFMKIQNYRMKLLLAVEQDDILSLKASIEETKKRMDELDPEGKIRSGMQSKLNTRHKNLIEGKSESL